MKSGQGSSADAAVQKAVDETYRLVESGESEAAIDFVLDFKPVGEMTRNRFIRTLISTGQALQHVGLTRCALSAFERIKARAKPDAEFYYDVANGYQVLYDVGVRANPRAAFDLGNEITTALRYFQRALKSGPAALTNLGNLLDSAHRPLEALRYYGQALALDSNFAMAQGNMGYALEVLAETAPHSGGLLVRAYKFYEVALANKPSLVQVGGPEAVTFFEAQAAHIKEHFIAAGQPEALITDLTHEPFDTSGLVPFVKFYTELCIENDLYLNLHVVDRYAEASVGDSYLPNLFTSIDQGDEMSYVNDITFRLNEINESFATARLLFARSQYVDAETTEISMQTTLVNQLDYSASNLYVGLLKAAYKEAFSALDKVAVLLNHYLDLGHSEDSVYYGSVWFEPATDRELEPVLHPKVRQEGYRLLGLYLLCLELRGSQYSQLRNAMTHRYVRVYRGAKASKGGYQFEDLTDLTSEILYKVKCAIVYASMFVGSSERAKHKPGTLTGTIPLNTDQNLDLW